MDSVEIKIDVSESYINRVEAGHPVVATTGVYPGEKFPQSERPPAESSDDATVKAMKP